MKKEQFINPKDIQGMKKVQLWLVPDQVIAEVAKSFEEGAKKYQPYNWRKIKIQASQYISACKRHLAQWTEGEELDKDSGLNHITKAISTLVVLRDAMMNDMIIDDRPPKIKDYDIWK